jgi:hypothetical protein
VASCHDCHAEYFVDRDTIPEEPSHDHGVCPSCGSTTCAVTLECDAATRRCAYHVHCDCEQARTAAAR